MIFKKKQFPTFVIIGAQKCGTTSLHYYLDMHPEIFMSRQKELNFFSKELGWWKGLNWYRSHFKTNYRIRGESSPHYTHYPWEKGVPERMARVIPDAKLIYIVRDPIERLISKYLSFYKVYGENRSFDEFLTLPENDVNMDVSKYYMQIEQYLPFYSKEQILILATEDLRKNRKDVLKRVFRFLEVDENFYCPKFDQEHNVAAEQLKYLTPRVKEQKWIRWLKNSNRPHAILIRRILPEVAKKELFHEDNGLGIPIEKPILSDGTRKKLVDFFKDDVQKLRELTNYEFKEWCL